MFLVKHGVPLDVAFSLDPAERFAWVVTMAEFDAGKRFDWQRMAWPPSDA